MSLPQFVPELFTLVKLEIMIVHILDIGHLTLECACTSSDPEVDCPIGECQCDGQLRINHDCTEGK